MVYRIALVVLNYNSAEDTIKCVERLVSFNKGYQIIVVDNCSTDNSAEKIKSNLEKIKNVDIIYSETNKGYSVGNNIGIKYAISKYNSEIVGILNPDVIIPKAQVIDKICTALMSCEKYAIAGGVTINAENQYDIKSSCWNVPSPQNVISDHFLMKKRKDSNSKLKMLGDNIAETECIAGCFFLAKTKIIEKLGFLDENVFLYNEENILGIKCKKNGYKEIIVLDQFYIHNHEYKRKDKISLKNKLNKTKAGYESRKYMCKVYYNKKLLPLLAFVELINKIYLIICHIKNGILG